jgi:hypothetical protein
MDIQTLALYNFAKAATRQARPAADDASPAPVGKVFTDDICTLYWGQSSFFTITAPVTGSHLSWASFLTSRKHVTPRPLISISDSFSHRRSAVKFVLAATVVIVCKSAYINIR